MQVVLNTNGIHLRARNEVFEIITDEEKRRISPEQISSMAITAGCTISSGAIALAAKAEVPLYLFDEVGDAIGCLRSPYFESLATLRRKQVYFSDSPEGGNWVLEQFRLKTDNQIAVLRYLMDRRVARAEPLKATIHKLQDRLLELTTYEEQGARAWQSKLMGWEGNQARTYWRSVSESLPDRWAFGKRSRRPAMDPFNAMLNYYYGMLYSLVEQALFAAGLDPHLGILHVDAYDRPTLAFDLIEPFRPWLDRLVVEQCMRNKVSLDFFDDRNPGFYLNRAGKRYFIPLFNEWMQKKVRWRKRQLNRTAQIYRHAAELANLIRHSFDRP